jgi:LysM repeat protein
MPGLIGIDPNGADVTVTELLFAARELEQAVAAIGRANAASELTVGADGAQPATIVAIADRVDRLVKDMQDIDSRPMNIFSLEERSDVAVRHLFGPAAHLLGPPKPGGPAVRTYTVSAEAGFTIPIVIKGVPIPFNVLRGGIYDLTRMDTPGQSQLILETRLTAELKAVLQGVGVGLTGADSVWLVWQSGPPHGLSSADIDRLEQMLTAREVPSLALLAKVSNIRLSTMGGVADSAALSLDIAALQAQVGGAGAARVRTLIDLNPTDGTVYVSVGGKGFTAYSGSIAVAGLPFGLQGKALHDWETRNGLIIENGVVVGTRTVHVNFGLRPAQPGLRSTGGDGGLGTTFDLGRQRAFLTVMVDTRHYVPRPGDGRTYLAYTGSGLWGRLEGKGGIPGKLKMEAAGELITSDTQLSGMVQMTPAAADLLDQLFARDSVGAGLVIERLALETSTSRITAGDVRRVVEAIGLPSMPAPCAPVSQQTPAPSAICPTPPAPTPEPVPAPTPPRTVVPTATATPTPTVVPSATATPTPTVVSTPSPTPPAPVASSITTATLPNTAGAGPALTVRGPDPARGEPRDTVERSPRVVAPRPPSVQRRHPDPALGEPGAPPSAPVRPESGSLSPITVKPGDSLWKITEQQLATQLGRTPTTSEIAARWVEVVEFNRAIRPPQWNPDLIQPGDLVLLPKGS